MTRATENAAEKIRRTSRDQATNMTVANWTAAAIAIGGIISVSGSDNQFGPINMIGLASLLLLTYIAGALRQIVRLLADIHEAQRP